HRGNTVHTIGELPAVGSAAPDFRLTDANLNDVSLASFKGKKKLLNIYPSIDTPTCALSTRKFNEYAAKHPNVVMLMVSADLPFAQQHFCSAENTHNVKTLSMMRSRQFAKDYGVLLLDGLYKGITARAIVVIDENDKVIHTEQVPEIRQEPNYEAALAALK
ncbi:MAG: thiol peroxidase, partial [Gammaproteobacteria bacterium]|nr:thiol peroxidase [Gammaproteobacteria bacterium]